MEEESTSHSTGARFIGQVCTFDSETRDVFQDPDGRQWIVFSGGPVYGQWLPQGYSPWLPEEKILIQNTTYERKTCSLPLTDISNMSNVSSQSDLHERSQPEPLKTHIISETPLSENPVSSVSFWSLYKGYLKGPLVFLTVCVCFPFAYTVLTNERKFGIDYIEGMIITELVVLPILLLLLIREKGDQEVLRKRLEHERGLRDPDYMAYQERERENRKKQEELEKENQKRQEEEKEHRRKVQEEFAARNKWNIYHESKTIDEIERFSGIEFEEFLGRLFSRMGYTNITLTPSNDQGGDLLCNSPEGVRVVVQAKRWKGPVGNRAAQELLGAFRHYGCSDGLVVTNSTFTRAARELAEKDSHIKLCDGQWLAEQIKKFLPAEIPEFNWEEFNRVVRDWIVPQTHKTRLRIPYRHWRRRRY